jgi:hypothetical protein
LLLFLCLCELFPNSSYPLFKLLDLQLQGKDYLIIPTFTEVLLCSMILLSGGSRCLQLLALTPQHFLGSAGFDLGEFMIWTVLLCIFLMRDAICKQGIAFAALCLFVERRRLFLGKLTFKITASAINTFALFGFPRSDAELKGGLCLPLPFTHDHPNILLTFSHGIRVAPPNLLPTGFLPVCSEHNEYLRER